MAEDYKPRTAQDEIAPFGPLQTDLDNAKAAEDAGVFDAAYVDYEKALKNYEGRSDVETLEARLAREIGGTFGAASFVRETDGEPVGVVTSKQVESATKHKKESDAFHRKQAAHTADAADV